MFSINRTRILLWQSILPLKLVEEGDFVVVFGFLTAVEAQIKFQMPCWLQFTKIMCSFLMNCTKAQSLLENKALSSGPFPPSHCS